MSGNFFSVGNGPPGKSGPRIHGNHLEGFVQEALSLYSMINKRSGIKPVKLYQFVFSAIGIYESLLNNLIEYAWSYLGVGKEFSKYFLNLDLTQKTKIVLIIFGEKFYVADKYTKSNHSFCRLVKYRNHFLHYVLPYIQGESNNLTSALLNFEGSNDSTFTYSAKRDPQTPKHVLEVVIESSNKILYQFEKWTTEHNAKILLNNKSVSHHEFFIKQNKIDQNFSKILTKIGSEASLVL